jgi:hypothetical protein
MKAEPGCGFTHASARRQLQHNAGTLGTVTGSGARLGERAEERVICRCERQI